MNKSLELILKRMETAPEDFAQQYEPWGGLSDNKWGWLTGAIRARYERKYYNENPRANEATAIGPAIPELPWFSDEEIATLYAKIAEIQETAFHERVMTTIMQDESEGPDGVYAGVSLNSISHPSKRMNAVRVK